jgi:hypothetical protein
MFVCFCQPVVHNFHPHFTYVFSWIFFIAIIHARGSEPGACEKAKPGLCLVEFAGQKAREFTLDELGVHAIWQEVR